MLSVLMLSVLMLNVIKLSVAVLLGGPAKTQGKGTKDLNGHNYTRAP
jgi:hypothetical protein